MSPIAPSPVPLVVIPCLNEAAHIARVTKQMSNAVRPYGGRVVVADGGSTDGSRAVVREIARRDPRVHFLDNPARIQSAGINAAVAAHGAGHSHLIRVDAHCAYPDGFIPALLVDAEATGASAVVVGMIAAGDGVIQRINAATQNARIGNGGSKHRAQGRGEWVDHGHHALIRLDAFHAVGGYDASFAHNEDAELDARLTRAGHGIWLTARTAITYYPRTDARSLLDQYFRYGRGRARNLLKHRALPNRRQWVVISVAPTVALVAASSLVPLLALPAFLWMAAALAGGVSVAVSERAPVMLLSGGVAMLMHVAWSVGFWTQLVSAPTGATRGVPA